MVSELCREVVPPQDNLDFFFPGKNSDLGAGSAGGFYARQVARQECGALGIEASTSARNWKQAPTIFWVMPAWSSQQARPIFWDMPAWSSAMLG